MKELKTLTKFLVGAGVLTIIFSLAWHIVYPDVKEAMITIMMGVFIFGFAYLCQWTRKVRESNDELDSRINAMDMWAKENFDSINQILKNSRDK